MNWRAFLAVAILGCLVLGFAPAHSQTTPTSGVATVSVDHYYIVTSLGFGVLNDSFTFSNPGNTSVTIPPIQVALPSRIAARTEGVVLSPSNEFTVAQSSTNGSTTVTITPDQPTLNSGASATVALKAVLSNIMNYSNGAYTNAAKILVLVSPGLNVNVTSIKSDIILPTGGAFTETPTGFTAPVANATTPTYSQNQSAIQPKALAEYLNFTDINTSGFTPITVNSLVRTIVPTTNGIPMVEDTFSLYNVASYSVSQIHLYLLNPGLTSVILVPDTVPPLLNPQITYLGSGEIAFASNSLSSDLLANSNITLTVEYPLPASMATVSGNTVKISIPYSPVIAAPVDNYSIILAPEKGIVPSGPTTFLDKTVTPFTPGTIDFTYTVTIGWAANQAIPAGVLVFAFAFALFAVQKPTTEEMEEKEEKGVRRVADVLNAFEDKTGLEAQYMNELSTAEKGSVGKSDFDKMRSEIGDLRSRALLRLGEMKAELGSGKQFDLLTKVVEAEKEEDRAFRDLLNLYQQYLGSRMNEATFRRLQPNYRKRVDTAIDKLSDLLHETQTEEK